MIDRSARGYDRLARVYGWLEHSLFGSRLQRARVSLLPDLPRSNRALILGDGDGRLLEQLCRTQPHCKFTSVDQSDEMLKLQRLRIEEIGSSENVEFVCADARNFRPVAQQYDLLVTAFFLDCFERQELSVLLGQWIRGLRPGGHLYFVDFAQPRSGWRRYRAACYLAIMHGFFRWQTGLPNRRLVDLDAALDEQPLALIQANRSDHEFIVSRLYEFVPDEST